MFLNLALILSLFLTNGADLEIAGDFVSAGQAYYEDTDISGEARILCRFLEEALYSGSSEHAFDLIMQLEQLPFESSFLDFWYARLSWNCGMPQQACEALDAVAGSMWLQSRARGLAAQFRGDAEEAVVQFRLSLTLAESARQRFYSALDLSFALIQTGSYDEAGDIAVFLAGNFPGESLPLISLALNYQEQDRFGEAMSILQSVYAGDEYTFISRHFAAALLEDLE
ncbi:MAG: hypothetical protein KAR44_01455 [Candidatus Aegiribacteria sp.]|nr:hypothetical protein [Candidatus Aegiribacteria sp.]